MVEPDEAELPPFLRECPTEPEQMPLQVSLLTMEVAAMRLLLIKLARHLGETAIAVAPYSLPAAIVGASDARGNSHDHDNGRSDRG